MMMKQSIESLRENLEKWIVRESDGFFEDPDIRQDLGVTIRIAAEFHEFLKLSGDSPSPEEVDYAANTIRSGIDHLFSLAFLTRSLDTSELTATLTRKIPQTFPDLRDSFVSLFESFSEPRVKAVDRLLLLLELGRLQIFFLALYFPIPL
jgi:hypothetical protein